jgi:hypothetical protein
MSDHVHGWSGINTNTLRDIAGSLPYTDDCNDLMRAADEIDYLRQELVACRASHDFLSKAKEGGY